MGGYDLDFYEYGVGGVVEDEKVCLLSVLEKLNECFGM